MLVLRFNCQKLFIYSNTSFIFFVTCINLFRHHLFYFPANDIPKITRLALHYYFSILKLELQAT